MRGMDNRSDNKIGGLMEVEEEIEGEEEENIQASIFSQPESIGFDTFQEKESFVGTVDSINCNFEIYRLEEVLKLRTGSYVDVLSEKDDGMLSDLSQPSPDVYWKDDSTTTRSSYNTSSSPSSIATISRKSSKNSSEDLTTMGLRVPKSGSKRRKSKVLSKKLSSDLSVYQTKKSVTLNKVVTCITKKFKLIVSLTSNNVLVFRFEYIYSKNPPLDTDMTPTKDTKKKSSGQGFADPEEESKLYHISKYPIVRFINHFSLSSSQTKPKFKHKITSICVCQQTGKYCCVFTDIGQIFVIPVYKIMFPILCKDLQDYPFSNYNEPSDLSNLSTNPSQSDDSSLYLPPSSASFPKLSQYLKSNKEKKRQYINFLKDGCSKIINEIDRGISTSKSGSSSAKNSPLNPKKKKSNLGFGTIESFTTFMKSTSSIIQSNNTLYNFRKHGYISSSIIWRTFEGDKVYIIYGTTNGYLIILNLKTCYEEILIHVLKSESIENLMIVSDVFHKSFKFLLFSSDSNKVFKLNLEMEDKKFNNYKNIIQVYKNKSKISHSRTTSSSSGHLAIPSSNTTDGRASPNPKRDGQEDSVGQSSLIPYFKWVNLNSFLEISNQSTFVESRITQTINFEKNMIFLNYFDSYSHRIKIFDSYDLVHYMGPPPPMPSPGSKKKNKRNKKSSRKMTIPPPSRDTLFTYQLQASQSSKFYVTDKLIFCVEKPKTKLESKDAAQKILVLSKLYSSNLSQASQASQANKKKAVSNNIMQSFQLPRSQKIISFLHFQNRANAPIPTNQVSLKGRAGCGKGKTCKVCRVRGEEGEMYDLEMEEEEEEEYLRGDEIYFYTQHAIYKLTKKHRILRIFCALVSANSQSNISLIDKLGKTFSLNLLYHYQKLGEYEFHRGNYRKSFQYFHLALKKDQFLIEKLLEMKKMRKVKESGQKHALIASKEDVPEDDAFNVSIISFLEKKLVHSGTSLTNKDRTELSNMLFFIYLKKIRKKIAKFKMRYLFLRLQNLRNTSTEEEASEKKEKPKGDKERLKILSLDELESKVTSQIEDCKKNRDLLSNFYSFLTSQIQNTSYQLVLIKLIRFGFRNLVVDTAFHLANSMSSSSQKEEIFDFVFRAFYKLGIIKLDEFVIRLFYKKNHSNLIYHIGFEKKNRIVSQSSRSIFLHHFNISQRVKKHIRYTRDQITVLERLKRLKYQVLYCLAFLSSERKVNREYMSSFKVKKRTSRKFERKLVTVEFSFSQKLLNFIYEMKQFVEDLTTKNDRFSLKVSKIVLELVSEMLHFFNIENRLFVEMDRIRITKKTKKEINVYCYYPGIKFTEHIDIYLHLLVFLKYFRNGVHFEFSPGTNMEKDKVVEYGRFVGNFFDTLYPGYKKQLKKYLILFKMFYNKQNLIKTCLFFDDYKSLEMIYLINQNFFNAMDIKLYQIFKNYTSKDTSTAVEVKKKEETVILQLKKLFVKYILSRELISNSILMYFEHKKVNEVRIKEKLIKKIFRIWKKLNLSIPVIESWCLENLKRIYQIFFNLLFDPDKEEEEMEEEEEKKMGDDDFEQERFVLKFSNKFYFQIVLFFFKNLNKFEKEEQKSIMNLQVQIMKNLKKDLNQTKKYINVSLNELKKSNLDKKSSKSKSSTLDYLFFTCGHKFKKREFYEVLLVKFDKKIKNLQSLSYSKNLQNLGSESSSIHQLNFLKNKLSYMIIKQHYRKHNKIIQQACPKCILNFFQRDISLK